MFTHLKKISLLCYTEQEWFDAQREMFKLGFYWQNNGNRLVNCDYQLPRVLQNYRNGDYLGGKYLIMNDYVTMKKWDREIEFVNLQNFKSFIRKRKIKKLKWDFLKI